MDREVTLSMIGHIFKKFWKVIVIFTLLAMILMGLFTTYVIEEKYSSSVKFYVINANPNADYTQQALIGANEHLSSDYIEIILSNVMLDQLSKDINKAYPSLNYTYQDLKSMITATSAAETSTFQIKVTHSNKEQAYIVAQFIEAKAPDTIKRVTKPWLSAPGAENLTTKEKTDCVSVLNRPVMAAVPDSPSLALNVLVAGIVTFGLVYIICFINTLFGKIIKTEEDIKPILNKYPLIGVIPMWNSK